MHPSKRAQIAQLKTDEAPSKSADFVDVFSPKLATKPPKDTEIKNYAIELVDD